MPTRTVEINLANCGRAGCGRENVTFTATNLATSGGLVILKRPVIGSTDDDGETTVELDTGVAITVEFEDGSTASIVVPDGEENIGLDELIDGSEPATDTVQEYVDSSIAYTRRVVTASTGTILAADDGKVVDVTRSSPGTTLTLPATFPLGFTVEIAQLGSGQVTLSPASGATLRHADGHTKTRQQYAAAFLRVVSNSDNASAEWLLTGDTAE